MRDSAPQILVVDDDSSVREALSAAVKGTYVVHSASTGDEACAVLRKFPVAAIILDAILEEEHGLDLVARFRTLSRARILLLTGHSSEELAIRAVRTHVDDYLKKPVNLVELRAALGRLLHQHRHPPDPVARARHLLEDHPERPHMTASLAKEVGLSERHLCRQFREAYGMTPRRYLTGVRMQRAAEFLRTTRLGIDQVAFAVGYSSPAAFARIFKRAFRVTPSDFRARALLPGGQESDGPGFPPT